MEYIGGGELKMKIKITFKDGMQVTTDEFKKEDIHGQENFLSMMLKVKYGNLPVTMENQGMKRNGEDIKSVTLEFED
jgi:hypothetical protein